MIVFGVNCTVVKRGGHDIYGQEVEGARIPQKCAVVKMRSKSQHSTVRVDSGATRAAADEQVEDIVLLFPKTTVAQIDDIIQMATGERLRVASKRLRYTALGKPDHYELACEAA